MNTRILFLSDINSAHTRKWAESLAKKGFEIGVFTLSPVKSDWFKAFSNITVFSSTQVSSSDFTSSDVLKMGYLKEIRNLKNAILSFRPDILHAHYATSYGLLGVLSRFRPFVISIWGSDVYDFPNKSFLHKMLFKFNLRMADRLLSTSHVMARESAKYTNKKIIVTPFGIDMQVFKPMTVKSLFSVNDIVIGTIKVLDIKYGIDFLIRAFRILKDKQPHLSLKLLIVGTGEESDRLKQLASQLNLEKDCVFTGFVNHAEVPMYHNMIDIAVFLSIYDSESFGVAVLEASACEKPVIVSKVGGLPEVVEHGVSGFVVPPRDAEAAALAIENLIMDPGLRNSMGKNGRERVLKLYDWDKNLSDIIEIYKELLRNAG
ncbi:MAG: glycosyltransferase [Bacteroidota bacterium]|nr:glycosyltransferase [Bacteroidota bacterium]